jgi:hypothetical protein
VKATPLMVVCVGYRKRGRRRRPIKEGEAEDGGAQSACPREERGRPGGPAEGHKTGWSVGRRGGEGRWALARSKTGDGPKFKKNYFSNFN